MEMRKQQYIDILSPIDLPPRIGADADLAHRATIGHTPEVKEGAAPQGVYVILAFDSLADAEKWYSTSPYADLIPERQKSAKSNVFIIEGLPQ